jgi:hypothetical protein
MIRLRQVMLYSAVAMLLIVGLAMPAAAQLWDKKTYVTINVPVRVGNVILPAGKYVMRLHDDNGIRRVVQIFNADETKLYTTTFGLPDFRTEATDETVMTFYEADQGRSPALRNWFYAASQFGLEFLDTRGPVQQVALAEPAPVVEPEPEPAPAPVIEEVEPIAEEPAAAPEPVAEIAQNEEPAPVFEPEPAPVTELPKTAGGLPLLALSGLLSLGAAASLRRFIR